MRGLGLPVGVIYSYKARFTRDGQGERDLDLLDNNQVEGSGRIVESIAESSAQEPSGQLTIKFPRKGSKVPRKVKADGHFESIPLRTEIWGYSLGVDHIYRLKRATKYGQTSGRWTVKGIQFGRPGENDIGMSFTFGVLLADERTSNVIREHQGQFVFLPEGVEVGSNDVEVTRIGQ